MPATSTATWTARDFVAWQTRFPTASGASLVDGDADGDMDGADFVIWQTNFPFTPGPGAAPVPEPAGWTMALLALSAAALRLRWCREGSHFLFFKKNFDGNQLDV